MMESFDVIMIVVAVVQPIAVGFIGWMAINMHSMNREIGELKQMIISIITQSEKDSKVTDRRFDSKQDKD